MSEEREVLKRVADGRSDPGILAREAGRADEDSLCIREFDGDRGALYAVADGLSGRNAGSVASAQAVGLLEEALEAYARHGEALLQQLGPALPDLRAYIDYVAVRIDAQLRANAEANPSLAGMATSLTAAYVDGRDLLIAHVGDSRAYRARATESGLQQLTIDDAPVDDEEFDPPPSKALGDADEQPLRIDQYRAEDGDILLLCTDGLWREVDCALMERILKGSPRPSMAVERLIRAGNQAGGRGNMAAVVVHIGEVDLTDDEALDSAFPVGGAAPKQATVEPPAETQLEPEPEPPVEEPAAEAPESTPPPEEPAPEATEEEASREEPGPVIPGPPAGGYAAVPEVVGRATYPRPAETPDDALRPRHEGAAGEARSSDSALFLLGLVSGIAFMLVIGGIFWGLKAWAGKPAEAPRATATSTDHVDYEEIVTHPVSFWAKPLGPGGRPCMILTKSLHEETGEESWEELPRLQGNESGPSGSVSLFRQGDALHMFLDVQFIASEAGLPRDCLLSLKVMPDEGNRTQTVITAGPDAGEQRDGHIEVISIRPGSVSLVPQDPDERLIAGGKAEATMGGQVNASGYYVQHFDKVPLGTYLAKKGSSERIVEITAAKRRVTVTFTE